MKGNNTLSINQATMIEAMQMYFDAQLAMKQTVLSVSKDTSNYSSADAFLVSFSEVSTEGKETP